MISVVNGRTDNVFEKKSIEKENIRVNGAMLHLEKNSFLLLLEINNKQKLQPRQRKKRSGPANTNTGTTPASHLEGGVKAHEHVAIGVSASGPRDVVLAMHRTIVDGAT